MVAERGLDLMEPLSFYDQNIPCLAACPVHTNAGVYVAAIADGHDEHSYLTARLPNPFASVCGRVCAAPCEDACRRGEIDSPIAIRALKRFVTEQYGVEAGPDSEWSTTIHTPEIERSEKVAIVGGGPAGLSAAHDLRRLGYRVSVFEAAGVLGGMMVLGIPEYRLDRRLLHAEIDAVIDLGVDVHLNTRLGADVTLDQLREDYDAVFLALGATRGRDLDIEGHEADGVLRALEFLININQGFRVDVGDRVVVIGGGNVAMDAARTALRAEDYVNAASSANRNAQREERELITQAMDAARTAVRAGAHDVTVVSLESAVEMPADRFEVDEAKLEGIEFLHRRGPSRILTDGDKVVGLETIGVTAVFDDEGRFAPQFDNEDRAVIGCDTVILAIGQAVDLEAMGTHGPVISPRRTIETDESLNTSLPRVWAGGDAASGPRNLIDAIADGRRTAAAIDREFNHTDSETHTTGQMIVLDQFHRTEDLYDRRQRVTVRSLPTGRRVGLREVELGFNEEEARCEASRCLRCFANVLLDVDRCVLCGLCVDVCPVDVLSIVPAAEISTQFESGTALMLDERACIRCALCLDRCPTDALSMGMWAGIGVPA
ncbi:MAG: FAD-dependent oxidoreductase [Acidimicrobiia bacterium]